MRFILRASAMGAGYESWGGHAWVDLDAEDVKSIFARKELFQMASSRDSDLYEMYYWNSPAYFFNALDPSEFLTEEEVALFDDNDRVEVPEGREHIVRLDDSDDEPNEQGLERVECEQTIIDAEGVRFLAILKHTDHYVVTCTISYELLLPMLEQKPCAAGSFDR